MRTKSSRKTTRSRKTKSTARKASGAKHGTTRTAKWSSPFATSFTNGIKSGKSCWTVVNSIAQRTGKSVGAVCQSLFNAGLCYRTKFNGTWLYWPTVATKASSKTTKSVQATLWQCFVDWCVTSGCCTPRQLNGCSTSQKAFMTFCRNHFNAQFNGMSSTTGSASTSWNKTSKSKSASKAHKAMKSRKTTGNKNKTNNKNWMTSPYNWKSSSFSKSFKFPTYGTRANSVNRRFRRAA